MKTVGRLAAVLAFWAACAHPGAAQGTKAAVWIENGRGSCMLDAWPSLTCATSLSTADLIWDRGAGEIHDSRQHALLAQGVDAEAVVASVSDVWLATPALAALARAHPLPAKLAAADGSPRAVFHAGETLSIAFGLPKDSALKYCVVADITANGEVILLFPAGDEDGSNFDRPIQSLVTKPFGTDTVVVLATAERSRALESGILALQNHNGARDAINLIARRAAAAPYAMAVLTLHTGP